MKESGKVKQPIRIMYGELDEPLYKETSQIIPIGKWTLQEACQQLKKWHSAGYANLKMGINLSAIEFEQKNN